jgi:hypothetical protein
MATAAQVRQDLVLAEVGVLRAGYRAVRPGHLVTRQRQRGGDPDRRHGIVHSRGQDASGPVTITLAQGEGQRGTYLRHLLSRPPVPQRRSRGGALGQPVSSGRTDPRIGISEQPGENPCMAGDCRAHRVKVTAICMMRVSQHAGHPGELAAMRRARPGQLG